MSRPTDADIVKARAALAAADPVMARADAAVAPLTWRLRPAGFEGLVKMVVEQQVSTAAAAAIWKRFSEGLGQVTPEIVLASDETHLRSFGLSGQKARYARAIAEAGELFHEMETLSDTDAVARLTAIKGVGRWTAETYLLFAEGRMDLFPAGDIALQEGLRLLEGAEARLSEKAFYLRSEAWRPYRSVAAFLLWGYYMVAKGRAPLAELEKSA